MNKFHIYGIFYIFFTKVNPLHFNQIQYRIFLVLYGKFPYICTIFKDYDEYRIRKR